MVVAALPGLVQCVRGVDQADVAERLRSVAELLAGVRVDLLAEQPEVVGGSERPAQGVVGGVDLPGEGLRLSEPERAQQEGAFLAVEAVVPAAGVVAADQPAYVGEPLATASRVRSIRGSSAGRKPTIGRTRTLASSSSLPNAWV